MIPSTPISLNRSLRQLGPQSTTPNATRVNSDLAKGAQIARLKERLRALEQQVRALTEENELLYGAAKWLRTPLRGNGLINPSCSESFQE